MIRLLRLDLALNLMRLAIQLGRLSLWVHGLGLASMPAADRAKMPRSGLTTGGL
jgi:hypothetical protein